MSAPHDSDCGTCGREWHACQCERQRQAEEARAGLEKLRAQRDQLAAALQAIADSNWDGKSELRNEPDRLRRMAREALQLRAGKVSV